MEGRGFGPAAGFHPARSVTNSAACPGAVSPSFVGAQNYNEVMTGSEFVDEREGWYYVARSRVSLASIIYSFRNGDSPETIRENFASLSVPQVYGALAFYLNNPDESEAYLKRLEERWKELERSAPPLPDDVRRKFEKARERLLTKP